MLRTFLSLSLFVSIAASAQITKKVCFIGNSYTATNDLPSMVSSLANADGNTLVKDENAPGGYTFELHSTNATSLSKISSNTWDYVVLQEQSQLPSFPWTQVTTDVLPFATILCDSIRSANPCAIPLFFDTWGRQFGDDQWDSIDTFTEMNQRLYNAYEYMADDNSGMLAPIGIAFEHINNDIAAVVPFASLYSGDGSHPSTYGTYLAACIFYETIFGVDPNGNTYYPVSITGTQAAYLQSVAHHVLHDVDSISLDFTQPLADFDYTLSGTEINFTNLSEHAMEYAWDFGDGNNSSLENPVHDFGAYGTYTVTLIATYCDRADTTEIMITLDHLQLNEEQQQFQVYPNPANSNGFNLSGYLANEPVEIFSTDGRKVKTILPEETTYPIILPAGTYILKTKTSSVVLLVLE
ncbi:MAG: T9SS type A sorting domain-containing protein [Crocinitomicaceae bacterium]|nr:T9SS type A sorting domain-containing protein [Crocinitomicaceae bacterium]MBK8925282.1 T9SS type A sorting domain-containing protein [Crocinitomicaceae bacterium]